MEEQHKQYTKRLKNFVFLDFVSIVTFERTGEQMPGKAINYTRINIFVNKYISRLTLLSLYVQLPIWPTRLKMYNLKRILKVAHENIVNNYRTGCVIPTTNKKTSLTSFNNRVINSLLQQRLTPCSVKRYKWENTQRVNKNNYINRSHIPENLFPLKLLRKI